MNSLVDETVLHGLGYLLSSLVAEPVIRVPGVCQSHLVTCLLTIVQIIVDKDIVLHQFCFPLIFSINPQNARESLLHRF